jgi:hypothetical protein
MGIHPRVEREDLPGDVVEPREEGNGVSGSRLHVIKDACPFSFSLSLLFLSVPSLSLNTSIEFLADKISLERRERLGLARDTGAAGVLLAAIEVVVTPGRFLDND